MFNQWVNRSIATSPVWYLTSDLSVTIITEYIYFLTSFTPKYKANDYTVSLIGLTNWYIWFITGFSLYSNMCKKIKGKRSNEDFKILRSVNGLK